MILFVRRGGGGVRRLADLGVIPGAVVQVLACHPAGGPIVLQLGGSHVAVGRGLASAIEVVPAEPDDRRGSP